MYRSGNRGTERLTDPPSVTQVRTLPLEVGLLSATFPVHDPSGAAATVTLRSGLPSNQFQSEALHSTECSSDF